MNPRIAAASIAIFVALPAAGSHAQNLIPNGGFEGPLDAWKSWGPAADQVVRDDAISHEGEASLRLPAGQGALYCYAPLAGGAAYRVSGQYRCEGGGRGGTIRLALCGTDGGNGSAGTRQVPLPPVKPGEWHAFERTVITSGDTVQAQVVLSSVGTTLWIDSLVIEAVDMPEWADPGAGAWDGIAEARTAKPVFDEVLSDQPGNYHVSMWAHALIRDEVPQPERGTMSDADWEREIRDTFQEAGEHHLGALMLPWAILGGEEKSRFWRTDEFVSEVYEEHGLTFDASAESSAVLGRAVRLGAEVLNADAVAGGARPRVSWVDPAYVTACIEEIQSLDTVLGDRPYVRAIFGHDEPTVAVHEALRVDAGEFMAAADAEIKAKFGYGKYGMPAPGDPEWQAKPDEQPLSWIAHNRWMGSRYADSARDKLEATKRANTNWAYIPCDYWLMSGHVPFDFSRMAKYSDIVEGDPYASSAERTRGRGMYNHGFGAKLLADLSRGGEASDPKPIEIVVQAFDYAGYEMTPDDLLAWCSQALRAGATSLCYYASDNPRHADKPRWDMMLHVAKTATEMNAIARPSATKTAILYCSTAHMAEGASSSADEIYTAYAMLGERLGCWFDIISDRQLMRGLRDLADYDVVYIPLATYADAWLSEDLEAWVRGGGNLICGDPTAFSQASDGTDTTGARADIFGAKVGDLTEQHAIELDGERIRAFPRRGSTGQEFTARQLIPGDDTEVVATYPSGDPAIVRHRLGDGKAILFGANPFTPASLLDGESWTPVLRDIQKSVGEKLGLPIWRFQLPAPVE